jgi:hypothetical protein
MDPITVGHPPVDNRPADDLVDGWPCVSADDSGCDAPLTPRKRTSSTELQRSVADQLIRLVRLGCPDEGRRAAATGLSLAQ